MKEQIDKKESKNIYFYFAILIIAIFIFTSMLDLVNIDTSYKIGTNLENKKLYSGKIEDGTEIKKDFVAKSNNLKKILIDFEECTSQYNSLLNDYTGNITISLYKINDNNVKQLIKQENINDEFIKKKSLYSFEFTNQKDSLNQSYELILKYNNKNDEDLDYFKIYYYSQNDNSYSEKDYVNGEKFSGSFAITPIYKNYKQMYIYIFNTIIFLIIGIVISLYIHSKKKINAEKIFILTVPILFLLMGFFMPPFDAKDETSHWIKAYSISQGKIFSTRREEEVPKAVTQIIGNKGNNFLEETIVNGLDYKIDNSETTTAESTWYFPICYLPEALGIKIASIFTSRPMIMYYFAKIFNIITIIILLYLAIKIIPFGKAMVLSLCYAPIAMELFTSISPDGMLIASTALFISYIFKLIYEKDKKLSVKDIIIISILSFIIGISKTIYLPIIFLIAIIPKEKYKNNSKLFKTLHIILTITIILILDYLWTKSGFNYEKSKISYAKSEFSQFKIAQLVQNPLNFIEIFAYSIMSENPSKIYGQSIAWSGILEYYLLTFFLIIGLILSALETNEKYKFKKKQKIVITFICFLIIAFVYGVFYIRETSLNSLIIDGVQQRYFIPIVMFLALICSWILEKFINIEVKLDDTKLCKFIGEFSVVLEMYTIMFLMIYL